MKNGLVAGGKTTWNLGKIIFPITLLVTVLQFTPLLPWVMELISPVMRIFGLSGDASIPLVLGNFLNLYAGIGAMLSLDLTVKEVFILAVMLSFSHNLLIESSVAAQVGVRISLMIAVRLGLAALSAIVIHLIWKGGGEAAQFGMAPPQSAARDGWADILLLGLEKAGYGVFQLALIVIPLMVVIQLLKDLKWLDVFSRWMAPVTRMLGMRENTSTTLAAGLLFGLAFGSAVMIQAVKEDGVSRKDVTIAFIFLVACHAIVEDTLIFIPLGLTGWTLLALFLIRLTVAVLLTLVVSIIWRRVEIAQGKEATLT